MSKLHSKLIFITLFMVMGLISFQIPFNKLAGSNVSFTLFDFFAPIAGAFLGPVFGVASVLGVEIVNNLIKQTPWTTSSIIRLFPTLFAVYYFSTIANKKYQNRWILAVPLLCMVIFLSHPTGRQVFYYPMMFWTIPLLAYLKRDNLFIKSLGATFTAHSVGGAAWIWAFNLPASVWNSLIPVVIAERLLFALGIAGSYLVVKTTLTYLITHKILPKLESISPAPSS